MGLILGILLLVGFGFFLGTKGRADKTQGLSDLSSGEVFLPESLQETKRPDPKRSSRNREERQAEALGTSGKPGPKGSLTFLDLEERPLVAFPLLLRKNGSRAFRAKTDGDGMLHLDPGEWTLGTPGLEFELQPDRLSLHAGEDLLVRCSPRGLLRIRVVDPGGTPLEGALVKAAPASHPPKEIPPSLFCFFSREGDPVWKTLGRTNSEGRLALKGVPMGGRWLQIRKEGYKTATQFFSLIPNPLTWVMKPLEKPLRVVARDARTGLPLTQLGFRSERLGVVTGKRVGPPGSFVFPGLAPKSLRGKFQAPGYSPLEAQKVLGGSRPKEGIYRLRLSPVATYRFMPKGLPPGEPFVFLAKRAQGPPSSLPSVRPRVRGRMGRVLSIPLPLGARVRYLAVSPKGLFAEGAVKVTSPGSMLLLSFHKKGCLQIRPHDRKGPVTGSRAIVYYAHSPPILLKEASKGLLRVPVPTSPTFRLVDLLFQAPNFSGVYLIPRKPSSGGSPPSLGGVLELAMRKSYPVRFTILDSQEKPIPGIRMRPYGFDSVDLLKADPKNGGFRPSSHPSWLRGEQETYPKWSNGRGEAVFSLMEGRYEIHFQKRSSLKTPSLSAYPYIIKTFHVQGPSAFRFQLPRPRRVWIQVRSSVDRTLVPEFLLSCLPKGSGGENVPFKGGAHVLWVSDQVQALAVFSPGFLSKTVDLPSPLPRRTLGPPIRVLLLPQTSWPKLRILGKNRSLLIGKEMVVSAYPKDPTGSEGDVYWVWQRSYVYDPKKEIPLDLQRKGPLYLGIYPVRLQDGRKLRFRPIQPIWMEAGQDLKFEMLVSRPGK